MFLSHKIRASDGQTLPVRQFEGQPSGRTRTNTVNRAMTLSFSFMFMCLNHPADALRSRTNFQTLINIAPIITDLTWPSNYILQYLEGTWFDFEKCLLHGPISINIPDNKATKYPQTRGYLHQKRRGVGICTQKTQGDGTAQKLYFLCFWVPCKWRPLHSSTSILADLFIIICVVQNKHFIIYVSAPTPLNVKLTWLFDKV